AALAKAPPLPAVNYGLVGKTAPKLLTTPSKLPKASTVVITWAEAESARFSTFSAPAAPLCLTVKGREEPGQDGRNIPQTSCLAALRTGPTGAITGRFEINGTTVLLFKSNTHL